MNIIYFGNGLRGVKCLEALCKAGFIPLAIVVHYNAGKDLSLESMYHAAKSLCIERVFAPKSVNDPAFLETLKSFYPDLIILSGYNQIFKKDIIHIPKKGCINLHGGYLPYYRGGSPINWQIINGETIGACAITYVDEGIDTGDIIVQETYSIGIDDTAGDVYEKTLEIFPRLLVGVVKKIEEGVVIAEKQDTSVGAYYSKRYPKDGRIFWDRMTAIEIHNLVRALHGPGLPGAFTFMDSNKIVIWKTERLQNRIIGPHGRIALKQDNGVVVTTKKFGILVTKIKIGDNPEIVAARDYFKISGMTFE